MTGYSLTSKWSDGLRISKPQNRVQANRIYELQRAGGGECDRYDIQQGTCAKTVGILISDGHRLFAFVWRLGNGAQTGG